MKRLKDVGIGVRLGSVFAVIVAVMIAIVAVASARLYEIRGMTSQVIEKDWAKAEAVNAVNIGTKANARRSLELLDASGAQIGTLKGQITDNRQAIDRALAVLDELVRRPEGKALLAQLKEARASYVGSLGKVISLVEKGSLEEAQSVMYKETLPLLDALERPISELARLQASIVGEAGQAAQDLVGSTISVMLSLGVAATVFCVVAALWVTRSILAPLREASDLADAVAKGDMTVPVTVGGKDELGHLLGSLENMQKNLSGLVVGVRRSSEHLSTASAEIASGNHDLSARTESQASALEETAASMEELSATVKQNADSARQANQLALNASTVAVKGGEVVARVVDTMKGINDSSRKISDIISVIDGIAFQTNILALNAAVEAARAGDQGRGFAVVATEVRSLAGRSAEAAKEIKSLIGASVERVEEGSRLVDDAGVTMNEVVSSIRRVADIMGEITAASQEQAAGVSQVGEAVVQMDQVTQQNAALVEQMAAAASSLKGHAEELVQSVAIFKVQASGSGGLAPMPVRSPASGASYAGAERREPGHPSAAAPAGVAASPRPQARPAVAAKAAHKGGGAETASKARPASAPTPKPASDDDWETF